MSIENDIEFLSRHEHFARFGELIYSLREEVIGELHKAPADQIQQISGRILSYDQILQMIGWEGLRKRLAQQ
jgi:hypothetical protein